MNRFLKLIAALRFRSCVFPQLSGPRLFHVSFAFTVPQTLEVSLLGNDTGVTLVWRHNPLWKSSHPPSLHPVPLPVGVNRFLTFIAAFRLGHPCFHAWGASIVSIPVSVSRPRLRGLGFLPLENAIAPLVTRARSGFSG